MARGNTGTVTTIITITIGMITIMAGTGIAAITIGINQPPAPIGCVHAPDEERGIHAASPFANRHARNVSDRSTFHVEAA